MEMHECKTCGAKYELKRIKIIMRDKDSINCNHCGSEIIRWNGGVMYMDTEISGPTKKF